MADTLLYVMNALLQSTGAVLLFQLLDQAHRARAAVVPLHVGGRLRAVELHVVRGSA